MTQFSDGVRVGFVGPYGQSIDPGVPLSPINVFSVVPASSTVTSLGASQVLSGAAAAASFTAGVGVTQTSINGVTYYDMGLDRAISMSGAGASSAAVVATVQGMTNYRELVTATISSTAGTGAYNSAQTMRFVRSIAVSGNTVSGVSFGTADIFGFPYRVDNFADVVLNWSSGLITAVTGFTAAVTTSPATVSTGDTRGTYATQSASNGVKMLNAFIFIRNPDTTTGAYGVTKFYNGP